MWTMSVMDMRDKWNWLFDANERILHGPFKTLDEAMKWWQKICDDILSEYEAQCLLVCGHTLKTRPKSAVEHIDEMHVSTCFSCDNYFAAEAMIFYEEE